MWNVQEIPFTETIVSISFSREDTATILIAYEVLAKAAFGGKFATEVRTATLQELLKKLKTETTVFSQNEVIKKWDESMDVNQLYKRDFNGRLSSELGAHIDRLPQSKSQGEDRYKWNKKLVARYARVAISLFGPHATELWDNSLEISMQILMNIFTWHLQIADRDFAKIVWSSEGAFGT